MVRMKELSLKGVGAGMLVMMVLSIPLSLMFSQYFVAVYNEVAPGVNLMNEIEVQEMTNNLIFHPLSIAFIIISTFIGVGIPSYIAAVIANKAFILNSMAISIITLPLCLFELEFITKYPLLFTSIVLIDLAVAYMAGLLRFKQVNKGA